MSDGESAALGTLLFLRLGHTRDPEAQHGDESQAEDRVTELHEVVGDTSGRQREGKGGWEDELHDRTMRERQ